MQAAPPSWTVRPGSILASRLRYGWLRCRAGAVEVPSGLEGWDFAEDLIYPSWRTLTQMQSTGLRPRIVASAGGRVFVRRAGTRLPC